MDLVDAARLLALSPQGGADASLAEFRSAVSEFTPADPAQASAGAPLAQQVGVPDRLPPRGRGRRVPTEPLGVVVNLGRPAA